LTPGALAAPAPPPAIARPTILGDADDATGLGAGGLSQGLSLFARRGDGHVASLVAVLAQFAGVELDIVYRVRPRLERGRNQCARALDLAHGDGDLVTDPVPLDDERVIVLVHRLDHIDVGGDVLGLDTQCGEGPDHLLDGGGVCALYRINRRRPRLHAQADKSPVWRHVHRGVAGDLDGARGVTSFGACLIRWSGRGRHPENDIEQRECDERNRCPGE
jgi:hypothetical protein